jgi:hypothetical protein
MVIQQLRSQIANPAVRHNFTPFPAQSFKLPESALFIIGAE